MGINKKYRAALARRKRNLSTGIEMLSIRLHTKLPYGAATSFREIFFGKIRKSIDKQSLLIYTIK